MVQVLRPSGSGFPHPSRGAISHGSIGNLQGITNASDFSLAFTSKIREHLDLVRAVGAIQCSGGRGRS